MEPQKNECSKYENDAKNENSFRKNSMTISAFAKEKYLVYPQGFNSFVDILVMIFISSLCKKCELLGCTIHFDGECVDQRNNRE